MTDELTTPALPALVLGFMQENNVINLATLDEAGVWSANVFYCLDPKQPVLYFLSSPETRHGAAMVSNPAISATICGQSANVAHLQGIQLSGTARLLEGDEDKLARKLYNARFAVARITHHPIWALRIDYLKMTNNRLGFGHKTEWPEKR